MTDYFSTPVIDTPKYLELWVFSNKLFFTARSSPPLSTLSLLCSWTLCRPIVETKRDFSPYFCIEVFSNKQHRVTRCAIIDFRVSLLKFHLHNFFCTFSRVMYINYKYVKRLYIQTHCTYTIRYWVKFFYTKQNPYWIDACHLLFYNILWIRLLLLVLRQSISLLVMLQFLHCTLSVHSLDSDKIKCDTNSVWSNSRS